MRIARIAPSSTTTRRIAFLLLAASQLALAAGCGHDDPGPTPEPLLFGEGDYRLHVSGDGRALTLARRGEPMLTFPADAFQLGTVDALLPNLSYDPWWYEPEPDVGKVPPPESLVYRNVTASRVSDSALNHATVTLDFDGGATATLTITPTAAGRFTLRLAPTHVPDGQAVAMIRLRPRASSTEGFYGLGEWGDDVNHRGHLRPMQIEPDLRFENATDENHVPVPLLIGTRGWGLFVESRRVGAFDVARKEPDLVEITYGTAEESAAGLTAHLFLAEQALDIPRHYYEVTGYPQLPAQWALGPWFWRNENKDQAEVLSDIAAIRDRDLAASAIWFDRPYATAVNTFDFDPNKFADSKSMLARVHDMGFRYAVWHTPYLEPAASALLGEANAKGYFPKKTSANLNKWGTPLDFTNPDAYAWWQGLIRKYTDGMGIEGFKLDYGEDIIAGAAGNRSGWGFADGSTDRTMHHGYVTLYHKIYAETLPPTGGYLLCRTGRWGDQTRVSVIWPGDLDATWTKKAEKFLDGSKMVTGVGGFPASIIDGLSLSASGFPFYASDTAGYIHSPAPRELWIRWAEQTALSTVMNIGDATSDQPWDFTPENGRDEAAVDILRTYLRLHLRLFPYEWTYAQNIKKDGRPITRPFGMVHPELGHPNDQYFFGDDLLVAPVVTPGATERKVILPPGDWYDWWTGEHYDGGTKGGTMTVPAPLDRLPLLARAGAIIPLLRPTIDTMSPTTTPDVIESFARDAGLLWVRVFPGNSGVFALYDGSSIGWKASALEVDPGSVYGAGMMIELVGRRLGGMQYNVDDGEPKSFPSLAALEAEPSGVAEESGSVWIKLPPGHHTITPLVKLP